MPNNFKMHAEDIQCNSNGMQSGSTVHAASEAYFNSILIVR